MRSPLPLALLLAGCGVVGCATAPAGGGAAGPDPAAPPTAVLPADVVPSAALPSAALADTVGAVQTRAFPVTAELAARAAEEVAVSLGWFAEASGPDGSALKVGVPAAEGWPNDVLTVEATPSGAGGSLVTVRSALADGLSGTLAGGRDEEDALAAPHVGAFLDALAGVLTL